MWKQSKTRTLQITLFVLTLVGTGFIAGNVTAKADSTQTQIVVNQEKETIYFIVGGEEIATLNAKGFYTKGNIKYQGTLSDTPYDPEGE